MDRNPVDAIVAQLETLDMGIFSWIAQDTHVPIYVNGYHNKTQEIYMWDNRGNFWKESCYEGYGMFGGKDYYVLLAEMNQTYDENVTEEQKREDGIGIEFCSTSHHVFPNLTESSIWTWINDRPLLHEDQGR